MSEGLKMVVHFGERDRVDGALASDVLMDAFAGAGVAASALLRGVEGFGMKHALRTDRLLTLSEDLPLLAVAVDRPEVVRRLVPAVLEVLDGGLVTLERIAMPGSEPPRRSGDEDVKLTLYCGRGARRGGTAAVPAVLALLRDAGAPGATALPGLDGTILGTRRRARFLARNEGVPALVVSVGPAPLMLSLLPRLRALSGEHVTTLERVQVIRRAGRVVGELPRIPSADAAGMALWQRVSVLSGERARWGREPLYRGLIRALREARAAGATALRGSLGYSDDTAVHGDRVLALRRDAPILVTLIDHAERIARLWPLVARATATEGLVTCETVPAFQALGPGGLRHGGLELADVPG